MLRFILVTASHIAVKRSKRLRSKYLSIVRRVGRNRAIVAVGRILAEIIYSMLKNGEEFMDKIDSLTERKMISMAQKARNAKTSSSIAQSVKILRGKLITKLSEQFFHKRTSAESRQNPKRLRRDTSCSYMNSS
jgi:hypothetical protein